MDMFDSEITVRVVRPPPDGRVQSSLRYLGHKWFPGSLKISREIRKNLKAGAYDSGSRDLVSDLKHDPALFTAALVSLPAVIADAQNARDMIASIANLDRAGQEKLIEIASKRTTQHLLARAGKTQLMQLKQSLVSATFVDELVKIIGKEDLSGGSVLSCAMFRQLGTNLIAWNYPDIFARALTGLKRGETLDRALSRALGIVPLDVAKHFAAEALAGPEVREALSDLPVDNGGEITPAHVISTLCGLGEAFARSTELSVFPRADKEFREREERSSAIVPVELVERAKDQVRGEMEGLWNGLLPQLFREPGTQRAPKNRRETLWLSNRDVHRCPEPLKEAMRKVYDNLEDGKVSQRAVQILIGEVVPLARFPRGCIYFLDGTGSRLVPAVEIGRGHGRPYLPLAVFDEHIVAESINSEIPFRDEGGDIGAPFVCGALGLSKKNGVMLLEIDPAVAQDPAYDAVTYYRAIRQCLRDCFSGA